MVLVVAYAVLRIAASILAARKLAQYDSGARPRHFFLSPAN
jgi:hypothetical protein